MKIILNIKKFHSLLIPFFCVLFLCCENEKIKNTNSVKATNTPKIELSKANKVDTSKDPDAIFTGDTISYDSTKKYIYLTFDDGPQGGTKTCFDICKKLGVKATFFMVGLHASEMHDKKLVRDIKYAYPEILLANHSTTHAKGRYHYFYSHAKMAFDDFLLAQKKLEIPYKIIRLPGNTSWVREKSMRIYNKETKAVCKLLDSSGYNVIGWDVEWSFSRKDAHPVESAEKMYAIVNSVIERNKMMEKNHLVILTHDRMFRKPNYSDSLSKFISLLKENKNYIFETVDHYPNLKKLK